MLLRETLNDFIYEVEKSYQFFCVWKYLHDERFNQVNKMHGDFANTRYYNFFDVFLVAIQDRFCVSIRALIDPAHDKENFNLSINYIIENIDDQSIKQKLKDILRKHKVFIKSASHLSCKKIAHFDLVSVDKEFLIQAGREDFYSDIENIISEMIKNNNIYNGLYIGLSGLEENSKNGVDAIFKDLLYANGLNKKERLILN